MIPVFLFDLLFEGHRGQTSKWHQYWHVSLLYDMYDLCGWKVKDESICDTWHMTHEKWHSM
jgi:hypothetical protein